MGNVYKQQRIHKQKQQHINVVVVVRRRRLPILCSRRSSSLDDVAAVHERTWPELEDGSKFFMSSTESKELEPLSPKVGCMGQVKRSNRVVAAAAGAPYNNYKKQHLQSSSNITTTTAKTSCTASKNNNNVSLRSYSKLKKLFSGKNLLLIIASSSSSQTPSAPAAASNSAIRSAIISRSNNSCVGPSCRTKVCSNLNPAYNKVVGNSSSSSWCQQYGQLSSLNIVQEMDPPLPVLLVKKKKKPEEEEEGERGSRLWKRRLGGAPLRTLELNQHILLHHPKLAPA